MQRITLEINNSIYDYIMFFLENLPKNLVHIKKETSTALDYGYEQHSQSATKEDFIEYLANNPIELDKDLTFLSREEAHER